MDHGDGQERALGGQPGCGNPRQCAQTGGVQAQPNLCLTSFEAKEGETEKKLMQWLNTKLL